MAKGTAVGPQRKASQGLGIAAPADRRACGRDVDRIWETACRVSRRMDRLRRTVRMVCRGDQADLRPGLQWPRCFDAAVGYLPAGRRGGSVLGMEFPGVVAGAQDR